MTSFEISTTLRASPDRVYSAWLDGEQHAAMTGGGAAEVDPVVGGLFSAWDGYISGRTLELEPPLRILQAWRTTEFPDGCDDSLLEVRIGPDAGGCKLTLRHSRIPPGQAAGYRLGWEDHYFEPMRKHFGRARR